MTPIRELLAEADPLRRMPDADPMVWDAMRHRIVAAAGAAERTHDRRTSSRRGFLLASAVAALSVAAAMAPVWWPDGGTVHAAVPFEVRVAEAGARPGLRPVQDAAARTVYVEPHLVVANGDIVRARVVPVGTGFGVEIVFTAEGASKLREATAGNVGRLLAVVVEGTVLASPRITSPIDGVGILGGAYTKDEAGRIAAGLVPR